MSKKIAVSALSANGYLFARHANNSEGLEETLTLNRQEVNATATALLATVG
ncbi:MAG: hypothetical protein AAGJ18_11080 [Bacteroidota bacterium]